MYDYKKYFYLWDLVKYGVDEFYHEYFLLKNEK